MWSQSVSEEVQAIRQEMNDHLGKVVGKLEKAGDHAKDLDEKVRDSLRLADQMETWPWSSGGSVVRLPSKAEHGRQTSCVLTAALQMVKTWENAHNIHELMRNIQKMQNRGQKHGGKSGKAKNKAVKLNFAGEAFNCVKKPGHIAAKLLACKRFDSLLELTLAHTIRR